MRNTYKSTKILAYNATGETDTRLIELRRRRFNMLLKMLMEPASLNVCWIFFHNLGPWIIIKKKSGYPNISIFFYVVSQGSLIR